MTNYEELVKALRFCFSPSGHGCGWCPYKDHKKPCDAGLLAAAAIEALQAQLPKRVEIVRCKECIHFTQGGWCDREFDWFPVDENDFCSMAEKMEAQDGK